MESEAEEEKQVQMYGVSYDAWQEEESVDEERKTAIVSGSPFGEARPSTSISGGEMVGVGAVEDCRRVRLLGELPKQ